MNETCFLSGCYKDVSEFAVPTARRLFRILFCDRLRGLFLHLVDLPADMGCLGRRMGQCNGAVEGFARLAGQAKLLQQSAPQAVIVEIAAEFFAKRIDEVERILRTLELETTTARLSVMTGDGWRRSSAR